jgi:hypothetical protein
VSISEYARKESVTVHYTVTCDGCGKNTAEVTTDRDLQDEHEYSSTADDATQELEGDGWNVVGDITDFHHVKLLCPDCPTCEEAGHSWVPTVAGDRIGCRICGVTPHVPLTGGATAAGMAELRTTCSV